MALGLKIVFGNPILNKKFAGLMNDILIPVALDSDFELNNFKRLVDHLETDLSQLSYLSDTLLNTTFIGLRRFDGAIMNRFLILLASDIDRFLILNKEVDLDSNHFFEYYDD